MLANVLWMAGSVAARVASGVLAFAIIARALGQDTFGVYMFWFSSTYLASLLAHFGLSNLLLRELGRAPGQLLELVSSALSARLLVSAVVLVAALPLALLVDAPLVMGLMLAGNLAEVLCETLFVGYRAAGRYSLETRIATGVAVGQLAVVILAVSLFGGIVAVAVAFCAGRLLQLGLVFLHARKTLGRFRLNQWRDGTRLLRRSGAYALDFGLGNLFGQIDSVILRLLAGVGAVGLFQAGMRVFQGGAQLAPVLANVFLPAVARTSEPGAAAQPEVERVQLAFLAVGCLFGLTLAYGGWMLVDVLFGDEYLDLVALMPLFGLLFFIRFVASSWGLVLTAAGLQGFRALATALHLAVLIILGAVLVPSDGVRGWLVALIAANSLLAAMYMAGALRRGCARVTVRTAVATVAGGAGFVPSLLIR